jgi:hypothetical protein
MMSCGGGPPSTLTSVSSIFAAPATTWWQGLHQWPLGNEVHALQSVLLQHGRHY